MSKNMMSRTNSKTKGLTSKQVAFVKEYVACQFNGTAAARKAGYSNPQGSSGKLLNNPKVQNALKVELERHYHKMEVSGERVIEELACIGFADAADFFDENGTLLQPADMPEHARRCIKSFKVKTRTIDESTEETTVELQTWDKPKALELLGKHLRLFIESMPQEEQEQITSSLLGQLLLGVEGKKIIDTEAIAHEAEND